MIQPIFTAVTDKLKTDIPDLQIVEWYRQQDAIKGGITACPAVYLEFSAFDIGDNGKDRQSAIITFNVLLFTDFFKKNNQYADAKSFDLAEQIFDALHRFQVPETFGPIIRTSYTPYHEASNYTKLSQSFTCVIEKIKQRQYTTLKSIQTTLKQQLNPIKKGG